MATVMNPHSRHVTTSRTPIQKVCIGMGILFIVVGLAGITMPGLLGLHLSMANVLIHLVAGAIGLWSGYADNTSKAYTYCLAFGAFFAIIGFAGFVVGEPGYPGVGYMEADENLMRVIPNVLEFGTVDHVVHLLVAAILSITAYAYKRSYQDANRSLVDVQRRRDFNNTDVFRNTSTDGSDGEVRLDKGINMDRDGKNRRDMNLSNDLSRPDLNRRSDINRDKDFERRV